MANQARGEIKIVLDKERVLKFTLNSLIKLKELGVDVTKLGEGVELSQIRALLWAGLIHEDKEITEEYIGDYVTMDNLTEISEAIGEAFKQGKK